MKLITRPYSFWFVVILAGILAGCGPTTPLDLFNGTAWVDAPLQGATLPNDVPYEIVAHVASQNGTMTVLIKVDPVEVADPSITPEVFPFDLEPAENGDSLATLRQLWRPKSPGMYLISVAWEDAAGNTGVSAARQVNVDGEAPQGEPAETVAPGADTPTPTFTPTFTPTLPAPTPIPPTPTDTAVPLGSISGVVYDDFNANGTKDGGELGIANVTMTFKSGGCGAGFAQIGSADSNGGYSYSGLTSQTYCLSVQIGSLPPSSLGWDPTQPDLPIGQSPSLEVNLGAGQNLNLNFGFKQIEPPS